MSRESFDIEALDASATDEGRTLSTMLRLIKDRCDEEGECWIWRLYIEPEGKMPKLRLPGKPATNVRRLVYVEKYGKPVPTGRSAGVNCGVYGCVAPAHVVAQTASEREKRKAKMGLHKKRSIARARVGQERGKLDWPKVRAIRASEETQAVLAERYGVSRQTISLVRRNELWREATPFDGLVAS